MILTEINRDEALKVLKYLEVNDLNQVYCDDEGNWVRSDIDGDGIREELGGRDGWSGLSIDREPYEFPSDSNEVINIDGVNYQIHESD